MAALTLMTLTSLDVARFTVTQHMGNCSFCVPAHELQVHSYPGRKLLQPGQCCSVAQTWTQCDDPYAVWMKQHHGNPTARSLLPWQSKGPPVVALWTLEEVAVTVFVAEQDGATCQISAYVVQATGGAVDEDYLLAAAGRLHQSWRQNAFRVSTSTYLAAMTRLKSERGGLGWRTIPLRLQGYPVIPNTGGPGSVCRMQHGSHPPGTCGDRAGPVFGASAPCGSGFAAHRHLDTGYPKASGPVVFSLRASTVCQGNNAR